MLSQPACIFASGSTSVTVVLNCNSVGAPGEQIADRQALTATLPEGAMPGTSMQVIPPMQTDVGKVQS